ncbi:MAG: DNA-binding transcriptional LysR family regulator [Candidatus Azotimanducaceae bacterium]|jgi:DNA-binding transcriptional LysR family regulator
MPIHIENQEIRVFKAIYEENGFKRAADKLFVTQSAVSQTLANLEKKLETILLERNPLKLTESGIRFLNYAEAALGEEQGVLTDINNIKNGILSTLLLTMNGTVNALHGARLMAEYCQDSPLTKIKLSVMPSRQIISGVVSDLWELGLGPFQQNMPVQLELVPLYQDTRSLTISKNHPDFMSLKDNPELLARQVPLIVSYLDDPDMRPAIEKLRNSFGTIWEINDMDLRVKLVEQGLGMSYLDAEFISQLSARERLVSLDSMTFTKMPLTFGLFFRKKKQLSSGARKFIEICKKIKFD